MHPAAFSNVLLASDCCPGQCSNRCSRHAISFKAVACLETKHLESPQLSIEGASMVIAFVLIDLLRIVKGIVRDSFITRWTGQGVGGDHEITAGSPWGVHPYRLPCP
jgi:hypothetical protein